MLLIDIFSLLGTISLLIAAFLITSKKVINPKIRILTFSFYLGACLFLTLMGLCMGGFAGLWIIIQQIVLVFINIRGIYYAVKEIKNKKLDAFSDWNSKEENKAWKKL